MRRQDGPARQILKCVNIITIVFFNHSLYYSCYANAMLQMDGWTEDAISIHVMTFFVVSHTLIRCKPLGGVYDVFTLNNVNRTQHNNNQNDNIFRQRFTKIRGHFNGEKYWLYN
jgi:hypothetical protein